jgi:hypothetical protein
MSPTESLPVAHVIVVFPFGFPGGTGLGSARRTTPGIVESIVDVGEEDASELDAFGGSQPAIERPARVRQIQEMQPANDCLRSVSMIALKNACCRQVQPLSWKNWLLDLESADKRHLETLRIQFAFAVRRDHFTQHIECNTLVSARKQRDP